MIAFLQLLFPGYVGIVTLLASLLIAGALLDTVITKVFKAAKLWGLLIDFMFHRSAFRAWLAAKDVSLQPAAAEFSQQSPDLTREQLTELGGVCRVDLILRRLPSLLAMAQKQIEAHTCWHCQCELLPSGVRPHCHDCPSECEGCPKCAGHREEETP